MGQGEHEAFPPGEEVLPGQAEHEILPATSLYVPVPRRQASRDKQVLIFSGGGPGS